jgi:uncharacterized protein (UPF0333 family)
MFRLLNNRRGQNTAEYAILIGVIVAAAIAMQIYVRRGMSGRIKDAVDYSIQDPQASAVFNTQQYEPYYMAGSEYTTEQSGTTSESVEQGGIRTYGVQDERTERSGNVTYSGTDNYNPGD